MDWNNDDKKDLIIGESYNNAHVRIYLNVGTDANPMFNGYSYLYCGGTPFLAIQQAAPEICDWNNDGRKDVLCGNINGNIYLLLNTGTDAAPVFSASTLILNGGGVLDVGSRASPVVTDWNNDGRKDLLVGCEAGTVYFFENKGTDAAPSFNGSVLLEADGSPVSVESFSRIDVCDWNDDGIADLLAGNDPGNVWYFGAVNPALPFLEFSGWFVNDSDGNTNGTLNASETVQLIVCLSNSCAEAQNVTAELTAVSTNLTVTKPRAVFGTIGTGEAVRNADDPFCVTVSASAPPNGLYAFELRVWYDGCTTTGIHTFTVGSYGTDTNAAYSWIDTTGGLTLPLTDEGRVTVNLPWSFPYYGQDWTAIGVVDNGYLMLGSTTIDFINVPIPDQAQPNGIIAPFWDDMDPDSGGIIRVQGYGLAPNRYVVFEWNQVPRYWEGGSFTFEVILYETGLIKFQYGAMTGIGAGGSSATIGIESPDGTEGIQHSCDRTNAVSQGTAIVFDLSGASPDVDGDGLPDWFEQFFLGSLDAGPDDDSDGDGLSNIDELRSATHPGAAASALRINETRKPLPDQFVVKWPGIPGKEYNLETRPDLLSGSWNVTNPAPITAGTDGACCYTGTIGSLRRHFYRVTLP